MNLNGFFSKSNKNYSTLKVSVADTPYRQQQGLMYRKKMDDDEGMYFVFSRDQKLKFWGENTYLPLDIAFVDKNGIIKNIEYIAPMSRKAVVSDGLCRFAIEANDGYFNRNKIDIGDKVFLHKDDNGSNYLSFVKKRRSEDLKRVTSKDRLTVAQGDMIEDPNKTDNDLNDRNLPVLDVSQLGSILEDDIELNQDQTLDATEDGGERPPYDISTEPEETDFEYPVFGNVFDAAEWAEQNSEVMRISYTTNKGLSLIRDVEPHGSFHAKTTGNQILVTFDQSVGDIRAFILTNILAFSFVGERFLKKFRVS